MVLVDVKPSGLKAEAKIQWTAAQLIGGLLVCFFSLRGLFLQSRLVQEVWNCKENSNRNIRRGNFNQILLFIFSFNFGVIWHDQNFWNFSVFYNLLYLSDLLWFIISSTIIFDWKCSSNVVYIKVTQRPCCFKHNKYWWKYCKEKT